MVNQPYHAAGDPHDHPGSDELLDLALGHLDEPERDRLAAHVQSCPDCRVEHDEYSSGAEQILAASVQIEPPPGFERSVLDRIGLRDWPRTAESVNIHGSIRGSKTKNRRGSHRTAAVVAAAALAALAGASLGVAGTMSVIGNEPPAFQQGAENVLSLSKADGSDVGTVTAARVDGEQVLVIGVAEGPVGKRYHCRLTMEDGSVRDAGSWTLGEKRPSSWVVQSHGSDIASVELVTDSGHVWSSAQL